MFTFRGGHSALPAVVVDVEPHRERIHELGRFYREVIGFGDRAWLEQRLRAAGAPHGLACAEAFDAWETRPGIVGALLPAEPADDEPPHPDRPA